MDIIDEKSERQLGLTFIKRAFIVNITESNSFLFRQKQFFDIIGENKENFLIPS